MLEKIKEEIKLMVECICGKSIEKAKFGQHKALCIEYRNFIQEKLDRIDIDELKYKYFGENESLSHIAELYDLPRPNLEKFMRNLGFRIKSLKEVKNSTAVKNRTKQTCIDRYGVENPSQAEEIKIKKAQTTFEHYGVYNPSHCEEIVEVIREKNTKNSKERGEKAKVTCLKKFGCEYAAQAEEIKEKIKQTCLEKFGCENPFQSEEIKEKIKQTCLEKFGCEYAAQAEEVKEKMRQGNLKNCGYEYSLRSPEVREKIEQTNLLRYGYRNPLIESDLYKPRRITKIHRVLIDFVKQLELEYEIEKYIKPYSVDIFVPCANLCIEAYGDYWHANPNRYKATDILWSKVLVEDIWKKDELRKQYCLGLGFNFVSYWETEINNNLDEVKLNIQKVLHENKIY